MLATLILLIIIIAFFRNNLVWNSNINKHLENIYKQPISVKGDKSFSYKGKNYRIILSTPKDKNDELYVQCFEDVINGTFYKPTYGAVQGKSKSLYAELLNYTTDGINDSFNVVYGYNKGLQASSFSAKSTDNSSWISQNISNEEYFLYPYSNIVYTTLLFKDSKNNDITKMFINQ